MYEELGPLQLLEDKSHKSRCMGKLFQAASNVDTPILMSGIQLAKTGYLRSLRRN